MPMYEVEHVAPLTSTQQDDLAAAITKIHSEMFTTPVLFINVRFTDVRSHVMYVSGKRRNTNRIIGYVRPGGGRGVEQFNKLITLLGEAWTKIVEVNSDGKDGDFKLRATFINPTIVAGLEKEFFRPLAGEDQAWLKDNLNAFKKLADEGDEEMQNLVREIYERNMINTS